MQMLYRFLKDESGATAIEYGLIAALVSVVIITAVATLGTSLERHDLHRSSPNLAATALLRRRAPDVEFPATSVTGCAAESLRLGHVLALRSKQPASLSPIP